MSISEGESDLPMSKMDFALLETWFDRQVDLLGEMHDAYGQGGRGYRAWWCDSATIMRVQRQLLIEGANIRALMMKLQKERGDAFRPETGDDPPF